MIPFRDIDHHRSSNFFTEHILLQVSNICTGKQGILTSFILGFASNKKIIKFFENTSKSYFENILGFCNYFRVVKTLSGKSTLWHFFSFLDFYHCPKFRKKLVYILWEKLAKNMGMDGRKTSMITVKTITIKDLLYTKNHQN